MINRREQIKSKGFNMPLDQEMPITNPDFSKIRVGVKTLDDAVMDLGTYKKVNPRWGDKTSVLNAINRGNLEQMREISNFFYKTSGIYSRLVRYAAYLYRYDWLVTPYINEGLGVVADADVTLKRNQRDNILRNFFHALKFLDGFGVKKFFGDVALKVIRDGCYYGYIVTNGNLVQVQELPIRYCRTRFSVGNSPAIEFDMSFFDVFFTDTEERIRALKLFPKEFQDGYAKYKKGLLTPRFKGDTRSWYLLEIGKAIKFNLNGEDFPAFMSVIPSIIDLDEAKDLDRKRVAQKLLRIIIQKMPIDKNGDLVFDVDEAQALHNNAVRMLSRAIGIDVLTTFADVDVADMSDRSNTSQTDDLVRVERSVYNEAGVSQMQFNSDSNIALKYSVLNDEASLYNLIQQFEDFLNILLVPYNKKPKVVYYRAQILTTTIFNYQEMAKLYKEQTQMGYSKVLPQIALGQSQSSILANAYFENDILDLVSVFVPPLTSNTMNAEALAMRNGNKNATNGESNVGRPEKDDTEKSDKTIANRESM